MAGVGGEGLRVPLSPLNTLLLSLDVNAETKNPKSKTRNQFLIFLMQIIHNRQDKAICALNLKVWRSRMCPHCPVFLLKRYV